VNLLKNVWVVAILVFLAGCSTTQTMNGIMSSWEGSNINDVVSQWGYPQEEKEFQGRKLYIWHHNKSAYIPQTTTTTGNVYGNSIYATSSSTGGYSIHGSCQRTLEVDDAGTVVSWEWRGNNCPFGELMEYSTWRKK